MDSLDFSTLAGHFADEDGAREFLESLRWPNGAVCPHCGSVKVYKLTPKSNSKQPARKGLYKCGDCDGQFTVTVGTIFEDSHIPLNKWLYAIHMMCSSKKGVSANQLHRTLGITYKSAWFMCHRIREAMAESPLAEKLSGIVEVDETYIGGKPRKENKPKGDEKETKKHKRGRGTDKTPVVLAVERDGKARAKKVERINAQNLRQHVREHVDSDTRIMTDGFKGYRGIGKHYKSHETVDHGAGELARGDVYTNTAESWFALLKRRVYGTFHHISDKHLDRYVGEFVFRWNSRKSSDFARTIKAISGSSHKRLHYKRLVSNKVNG